MFSSGECSNLPVELEKYKNTVKKESDYERAMSGTGIEIYGFDL